MPRFKVGDYYAPSCILNDQTTTATRVQVILQTGKGCSIADLIRKDAWKDCASFACSIAKMAQGQQVLLDGKDRINRIKGIPIAKTVR